MVAPFHCPNCGAIADGLRCARCGTQLVVASSDVDRPAAASTGRRTAAAYLKLEASEAAVLQAASRIFAGFIATGVVTPENEQAISERAIKMATRMALVIEKYIQSDAEEF